VHPADNAGADRGENGDPPARDKVPPAAPETVLAGEVAEAAAALGIELGAGEASAYLPFVAEQLEMIGGFLAAPGPPPPAVRPRTGFRPGPADDPYRAWLWRCELRESTAGLLAGHTVSFKDHISVAGLPQSFATGMLDGFVPDVDATVVARALAAGATVVGKNTMSGFTADFPRAINPRDPARSTGGSSSGSAVAVAAGEVDLSFGGDQGGSARLPAAFCGVLGLKPTFGLISHQGAAFAADPSLDHIGLLAADVECLARGLQAVAGADGLDPRQRPGCPEGLDALTQLEAGLGRLRVGLLSEGFDPPVDQTVRDSMGAAAEVLRGLGAQVVPVSVPEHRHVGVAYRVLAMEGARAVFMTGLAGAGARTRYPVATIAAVQSLWREHSGRLTEATKLYHLTAELSRRRLNGAGYAQAQNARPGYEQAYDRALAEVDVLLMPTVRSEVPAAVPPGRAAADAMPAALAGHWMGASTLYNLMPFNYTGHPALAVPCPSPGALPASMQLVGRHFQDGLLLRVAHAYLAQAGWPG
jgi:amidase